MPTEPSKQRMNREQVLELVRLQLADILEISPDGISESSSFDEDLNADSLALIELVEGLEEELAEPRSPISASTTRTSRSSARSGTPSTT